MIAVAAGVIVVKRSLPDEITGTLPRPGVVWDARSIGRELWHFRHPEYTCDTHPPTYSSPGRHLTPHCLLASCVDPLLLLSRDVPSSQAKVVEVEHRMLLSSMAWFTSLLCLFLMICSCCFKVCRRFTYRQDPPGRGERGGGGRDKRRYRGRRRSGDWSYECADSSPAEDPPTYADGDGGRLERLERRAGGVEGDRGYAVNSSARHTGDDVLPHKGHSGCPAERVRGNAGKLNGASGKGGVSRFCNASGGDVDDALLLDKQQQQKWPGDGRLGGGGVGVGVGMGGRVGARG